MPTPAQRPGSGRARHPRHAIVAAGAVAFCALVLDACAPATPPIPSTPPPADVPADGPLRIQILHTNDFHGRLLPSVVDGDTIGGSAVLAAWFDSARVHFDGPTILLDGGDVMQGTAVSNLSFGRAAIDVYNRKGYDAAALGNHEFDWGLDTLQARIAESRFPWLAANVFDETTGTHPTWVRPWIVIERGGARVGVVGAALAETPGVVMAGMTDGLHFEAEAPAIDRAVRALRAEGVDFVVLTMHVGAVCAIAGDESGTDATEPSADCAGHLVHVVEAMEEEVDLIVGGHTHLRNLFDVRGVPVMQNPAYSRGVTVTHLERDVDGTVRATHRAIPAPRATDVDPDTAVARAVDGWAAEIRPILEREVVRFTRPLSNEDRRPIENPAGNVVADAHRWATGADVGLVNNGALRRSLPAGPVSYEVLYEFQPFGNELVRIEGDGAWLRRVLEAGLTDGGDPWTHVSGIRVHIDPDAPRGERVLRILREGDGSEIGIRDPVTVGTTEFLAAGGDGLTVLGEGTVVGTGRIDLDALERWLAGLDSPVDPPDARRWIPMSPT